MSTAGIENINWQLRAGKDWKQAGTSCEIIHSCLHQVASQFSLHFGEKTWRRTGTRPLMKGKEYSKNYSRKHLNLPHLYATMWQNNQQLLHLIKPVLPTLPAALTCQVFEGILPRVRTLFVVKEKERPLSKAHS